MNITDVKVFPVEEEKLKAYATITFDNCFIVRDLKVISGNKGYFIAMPSKKRKDGTFRDVAHPLNSETRKMIEDAVLEVYEREAAAGETQPSMTTDDPVADLEETVVEKEDTPAEAAPVSSEAEDKGAEAAEPDQEPTEEPVMESSASVEEEPEKKPVDNPSIEPSQDPEKAFGYEE
ncbi:septation regulator SpoVG [bacterium]|nr:MAG: septation regulator SpoVG [bacterium]